MYICGQGDRHALLVDALERVPPRSYLEAVAVLLKWLQDIDTVLQSEKTVLGSLSTMNSKLDMYKVSEISYFCLFHH